MNLIRQMLDGRCISNLCPYLNGCHNPHCNECAFISKEDIKDIFYRLYEYEQSGLVPISEYKKVINNKK